MADNLILPIDTGKAFTVMLLVSVYQKTKFRTEEPDITANGEKKFAAEVAVTAPGKNGMRPVSAVISVGLVGGELPTIPPGTPVEFDSLEVGVSQANAKADGKGVSGGRAFYMGSGMRAAAPANGYRAPKAPAENAG